MGGVAQGWWERSFSFLVLIKCSIGISLRQLSFLHKFLVNLLPSYVSQSSCDADDFQILALALVSFSSSRSEYPVGSFMYHMKTWIQDLQLCLLFCPAGSWERGSCFGSRCFPLPTQELVFFWFLYVVVCLIFSVPMTASLVQATCTLPPLANHPPETWNLGHCAEAESQSHQSPV